MWVLRTPSRCLFRIPVSERSELRRLQKANFSAAESLIGWEVDDETKIGTITLQAQATYNALTVEMGQEFGALCHQIRLDVTTGGQEVHAIVLQGQGDKAFSAGGNFEWLRSLRNNSVHHNADLMLQFYHSFLCVRSIPVPIIAALQGPAIGAGAGLALACDLRTAAPKRKILGFNFTKLGIHAGMGGSHLLEAALGGPSAIMNEILLTGKVLSGEECLERGLVNRLANDAKESAYALANDIAKQHPLAVRTNLQTLRQSQDNGLEQALQREALAQAICYNREDWGEGIDAVAEKRDPIFEIYHKK
ncbi:enoyl-coa hydratase [Phaeodactylum tricornutum CCAP 1055/1]|jgi:enoyl-CoA hydratase|uniref:Enoyl-coa hydratase n=1 Tax=Phaeodactylum tricornutum (strain CCAP 1055/1) TaxID=556484 RepID=B7FZ30_PHATC|nr:enoyl-coa hydratase [Phaeodactylum tricornutum CCAP 1055/1]EEC48465.1 enoyl-coa hydratase [Phaeodactylum tricornutum CCAP 1055/1]|eukprot:XP_002180274.1 enoyl-coa hydratase [Phaeodactylum tricornutum CCAP 1055/1]